ncbi:MAG: VOC family protein [Culicoidibacterales bacterium]
MSIGAFSLSLNVKDIEIAKTFYEKIGFILVMGATEQKFIIMRNDNITIGLFEGMFDQNMMTFCPGWDKNNQELADYEDIRILAQKFQQQGIEIIGDVNQTLSGPASFSIVDPDGNIILIDQHV